MVTAILIGALIIHGLAPGPLMFLERGDFAYGLIFSFFWANIFNFIIALAALRLLVKVLATPRALLMPTVAVLCVIGSFALRNNFFDVYVMLAAGGVGYIMRRFGFPLAPMVLAVILGPLADENLRRALYIFEDKSLWWMLSENLTGTVLIVIVLYTFYDGIFRRR